MNLLIRRTPMVLRICLLLYALLAGLDTAQSQTWPTRAIKLIVPTGAGNATDVIARLMADGVARGLGQSLVVENLPGASGLIAHQSVARAAPDGYTFLFTNTSGLATNPVTFKSLPYDPAKDFTPVAMVLDFGPQMISVNAELPVNTIAELIAHAKANPGKLNYAADTTVGAAVFLGKLFNKRAGTGMVEVPYRSAAQMLQDVASGTVPVLISSLALANSMVQAGKIRRIALSSSNRFPLLPDLPVIAETVPGVIMDGWFAVMAPAGIAPDIVARMNKEIGEFVKADDFKTRLAGFGLATNGAGTPQSTAAFIAREQEKWRSLAKELDIQPQ
jgi:tripartite-type tricarboxylate transporter receptor subunit TctC